MDVGVFCLYCEAWSCRCSCMGSVSVLSCRCCMFVSCVHPVAVLNAAFCMTYLLTLLILFIPMWDIRPQCLFSTDDGLEQSPELHS